MDVDRRGPDAGDRSGDLLGSGARRDPDAAMPQGGEGMIDPRQLVAAQRLVDLRERADPLARYAFASDHHRDVVRAINARIEAHHRAANWGGKTQNIAAWCIAFMQGRAELGGEPMPIAGRPVAGAVLVSTQDQQKDSSQKALRDWLEHLLEDRLELKDEFKAEIEAGVKDLV